MKTNGAVHRAVDWTVGATVGVTVAEAVVNDPPHPSLATFLTRTAAATP